MSSEVKTISVEEATLKTATVEIKTVNISGKQMTLAVFRQIQEEDLIDYETDSLRGTLWGYVNYCPDAKCDADISHRHIIWQKGAELRRFTFYNTAGWGEIRLDGKPSVSFLTKAEESIRNLPQLFIAV